MDGAGHYYPTRDQVALIDELESTIADALPAARLHGEKAGDDWAILDELGLVAAGVAEAQGGSGLGLVEQAFIAKALGGRLVAPSVVTTVALLPALVAVADAPVTMRVQPAIETAPVTWIDEGFPAWLVVPDGAGAAVYDAPAAIAAVDAGLWGVPLATGPLGEPRCRLAAGDLLAMRLLHAGALAGIAEQALAAAVDYAGIREQFGRPIGGFQAVKHHCANMAIAARGAGDLVAFAAVALDDGRADAAHAVESAWWAAARAATGNAGLNIQIHGGIGFSAEAEPHLYLKRARLLVAAGGGTEAALGRIGEALRAA